jgi:hypothetical protein
MTRAEAQERLTQAVTAACAAGCTVLEIRQAFEFGCRDAGQLTLAGDVLRSTDLEDQVEELQRDNDELEIQVASLEERLEELKRPAPADGQSPSPNASALVQKS